ncbi:MAG: PAS domain S-box protein, partial [Anaerolineae bacterium]|nr:PAS domain S-box protein [Anaerolineae bacterium]
MRHRIVSLRLLAATLLLLTAVLVGGVRFYHTQQQLLQSEAEDELQAIADLKVNQIAAWRAERLADAGVLSRNSLVVEEVTAFFANPQATSQQERLLDRFQDLVDLYHYADVILVDPEGEVRLAQSGSLAPLDPEALRFIAEALRTRQPVLTTLHQNTADPEPHIATVAPLFASDDPAAPAVGAIILRSDATQFLFPLIQSWPLSSTSAETLIVRRDGDAVLFLNELRHQSGTALNLRIPLTETNVPAVMAVLGEEGIVSGLDYRGVEVLSVLRAIPDSDWYMVAKIDTAEVLADWITRSRLIIALMVGAVAILGLAGWSTWQGYEKTNLQRLYQEEKARQESEARYHTTLFSIGDGVIVTDSQARVTLLNPVAEALTGWTQAEAIGRPLEEIFVIVNEETRAPVESPVERVLQEGVIVGLANHTLLLARDGREIPIADSGAPIHAGAGEISGVVLVIRDQTDERAAQMKLAASEQRYRSFFENNRAVMLLVDPETAQIMDANPAAALYYGWDHETLCSMRIDEINTLSTDEVLSEMAAARAEKRNQFLFRHHRADGTIRDVEVYSVAVTLEGRQLLYSIVHDVTDRLEAERQVRLNESRLQSLFRISQHDAEDIQTLLDYALAEALQLTESQFGYIYHYDEDKRRFILNTWSGGVMDECTVIEPQTEYDLDLTGLWGEVVRQRKPILVNDFQESQPLKKGYPEGHVALHKYLSVPVFRGEQIVAVVGMANKTTDYTQTDIWQLSLLMDSVWKIVDRKRAEEALRASEALNRTILDNLPVGIAMSDADPAGKASYMNDNFVRLYRTTREAVVDRDTFWEAAYEDPEFREVMKQRIMADITSGDPARMYWEAIPITREGEETTYISARNTPIKGTALMLSTVWDITELRRSELEREEEHNLTRALRDTAAALI